VRLEFDVEPDRVTKDGKLLHLAYLWHDHQLLNEVLVEEGLVLAHSRSPNTKYEQRLSYAQEKARLLGVGIWNPKQPLRQDPRELSNAEPAK
jgi:micrococcal nuclease